MVFKDKDEETINTRFENYFNDLVNEYSLLLMVLLDDENKLWTQKFKELIHNNKQSFENYWKYFCLDAINNVNTQNLINECNKTGKNLTEIIGFTHTNKHLKFQNDFIQIGIFLLIGMNDILITRNQLYLTYKLIYEIYKNTEKQDAAFLNTLKEDIDIDQISLDDDSSSNPSLVFAKKLKSLFQTRMQELSIQY